MPKSYKHEANEDYIQQNTVIKASHTERPQSPFRCPLLHAPRGSLIRSMARPGLTISHWKRLFIFSRMRFAPVLSTSFDSFPSLWGSWLMCLWYSQNSCSLQAVIQLLNVCLALNLCKKPLRPAFENSKPTPYVKIAPLTYIGAMLFTTATSPASCDWDYYFRLI